VSDSAAEFIEAACVPLDASHASGTLERAEAIRAAHPEVATTSIHTAAILGDDGAVHRFLEQDPGNATAKGGPHGWDALTHLCFSRYLRLDPPRSGGLVRAAEALLDAGASANTGWFEKNHQPRPEWESVLYGAAGIAHHAELTRLLLERGADPNAAEVTYHTPETYNNDALKLLVESRKLTPDSLAIMLLRKADWHDYEGIKFLLEHGADPNRHTVWGNTAFHNSVVSDNDLETVKLMLDHGADPKRAPMGAAAAWRGRGESAVTMAAWAGRGDLLELFERQGVSLELRGLERLLAACARNDARKVRSIVEREPQLVRELVKQGGEVLVSFARVGNADGVRHLLDLGIDVAAVFEQGNGYFDIAKNSTALHAAAWRANHSTVKLLIERGAPVNARDEKGRTPLMLAVKACVDSYWTDRRSPESVLALLDAGASTEGVRYPSGYDAVDDLLKARRP
jgi:ankyrin repeat protein